MLQADPILHQLSQYIAKATRAYVPKQDDDNHTNLAYDALGDRLLGRWIQAGENALLPSIRLHDQAVIWYDDQHEELLVVPTIGRGWVEIEEDIAQLLPQMGLDPAPFAAPAPRPLCANRRISGRRPRPLSPRSRLRERHRTPTHTTRTRGRPRHGPPPPAGHSIASVRRAAAAGKGARLRAAARARGSSSFLSQSGQTQKWWPSRQLRAPLGRHHRRRIRLRRLK